MKQIITYLILIAILFSACSTLNNTNEQAVAFYYVKQHNENQPPEAIIVPELRSSQTVSTGIEDLITTYLQGALDPTLYSCYPSGTSLIRVEESANTLLITLSKDCAAMSPLYVTLSGSCLAQTLFPHTENERIIIHVEDGFSYVKDPPVFDRDSSIVTDEAHGFAS